VLLPVGLHYYNTDITFHRVFFTLQLYEEAGGTQSPSGSRQAGEKALGLGRAVGNLKNNTNSTGDSLPFGIGVLKLLLSSSAFFHSSHRHGL